MQQLFKGQVLTLTAAQPLICCCATTLGICHHPQDLPQCHLRPVTLPRLPNAMQLQILNHPQARLEPFAGPLFLLQRATSILLLEQMSLMTIISL